VDFVAVEDWIRAHVEPVGTIEIAHERPWSTVAGAPVGLECIRAVEAPGVTHLAYRVVKESKESPNP
jgi:hypothetical protein